MHRAAFTFLLMGICAGDATAQTSILQPTAAGWTAQEQCAADVQRICNGAMVECKPCGAGTMAELAACKAAAANPTPAATPTPCPACPPAADCSAIQGELNGCMDSIATKDAQIAGLTSERDSCAVALQAQLARYQALVDKYQTRKACVAKSAPATARRCYP